jgi:hypothetical protein
MESNLYFLLDGFVFFFPFFFGTLSYAYSFGLTREVAKKPDPFSTYAYKKGKYQQPVIYLFGQFTPVKSLASARDLKISE